MWKINFTKQRTENCQHCYLAESTVHQASVKQKRNIEVNTCNLSVRSRILQYCAKVMQTIIDEKSVCSDLSRFIADVSAKHLMDTINQRDIVLVRLLCNNISQSKRYIVAAKFVVTICRSELYFNDLS